MAGWRALYAIHLRHVPVISSLGNEWRGCLCLASSEGSGPSSGPLSEPSPFCSFTIYVQIILTRWELVVGLILIFFILFFKQGIGGGIENWVASFTKKNGPYGAEAAKERR